MKLSQSINTRRNHIASALIACTIISSTLVPIQSVASEQKTEFSLTKKQQEKATNREGVGFGIGAVVGGLIGGPIGIIVGGAAGTFVSMHINANREIEILNKTLDSEQALAEQQVLQAKQSFERKLQQAEQGHQQELLSLEHSYQSADQIQAQQLLMSLQFSIGSSEIAAHYQEQVAVLAQLLNSDETLSVDLSGYTDLIGEEEHNKALSLARVESVKNLLMAQGVDEERINSFAYGEAQPIAADTNKEVNFYDRRVVLQVSNNGFETAKN